MEFWTIAISTMVYFVFAGATLAAFYTWLAKQNETESEILLFFSTMVGLFWPVTAPMILGVWLMMKYVIKMEEKK